MEEITEMAGKEPAQEDIAKKLNPIPEEDMPNLKYLLGQLINPIQRAKANVLLSWLITNYKKRGIDTDILEGELSLRYQGMPHLRENKTAYTVH